MRKTYVLSTKTTTTRKANHFRVDWNVVKENFKNTSFRTAILSYFTLSLSNSKLIIIIFFIAFHLDLDFLFFLALSKILNLLPYIYLYINVLFIFLNSMLRKIERKIKVKPTSLFFANPICN